MLDIKADAARNEGNQGWPAFKELLSIPFESVFNFKITFPLIYIFEKKLVWCSSKNQTN